MLPLVFWVPLQLPDAVQLVVLTDVQVSVVELPAATELAGESQGRWAGQSREGRIGLDESVAGSEIRCRADHRRGAVAQCIVDLCWRDGRIRLKHQRSDCGGMRRRRRSPEEVRIGGIVLALRNVRRKQAVGTPIQVEASVKPRNVSLPPSGPTKSGFWRTTGVASRLPDASKRVGEPPCDENDSITVGVVPQAGVRKKNAAPRRRHPRRRDVPGASHCRSQI